MIWAIGWGLYAVVGLMLWRPLTGHFAWWQVERWYKNQKKPDGADWFFGGVLALMAASVWLALPALWLCLHCGRLLWGGMGRGIGVMPPIGAEARAATKGAEAANRRTRA